MFYFIFEANSFYLNGTVKKADRNGIYEFYTEVLTAKQHKKNRARTRINMKTGRCKMSFFFDLAGCWKLVYTGNGAILKTLRLKI